MSTKVTGIAHGMCRWYAANRTPFATQSPRPNAPCIRGSSKPRNRSSSPSTVLNTAISRLVGTGGVGTNSSAAKSSMKGTSTSQRRPPIRPVLGLRGACSHSASFRTGHLTEPRSW